MSQSDVFHLGLTKNDLQGAQLAIVPGDPQRVEKIAKLMENPVHLASHREFTTWRAELDGKAVIVCSTGIGGPSTSIAVEELAQLGIRTFLRISFPREDVTREVIAKQIALALRDEVEDLEKAGIGIIQIDEPALREGLPLRQSDWAAYLNWAVDAFKLNAAVAQDDTQIHTHMCYCEFNDIMDSIAALDADVITIETSRSDMDLLEAFKEFEYPNEIGPGVYDIHSPNVPSVEWIEALLRKAAQNIPAERLWVNPDCGLKTRGWPETRQSLANMVLAAQRLREHA